MKIVVFADLHGNIDAAENVVQIAKKESPQKVVFCGDVFGSWGGTESQVAKIVQQTDSTLYFVRGNNDRPSFDHLIFGGFEEEAVMYHFNRTLFFTHGDRYNGWRIPPILHENDAIVFGHTHVGSLCKRNGLFVLNVGSVARPRDGEKCYLVLDESGATLKTLQGNVIYFLPWQ